MPPFDALPQEIISLILKKLPLLEIVACRLTCKQWNQILNNNGLWESLLKNHFPSVDVDTKTVKNFHSAYQTFHNLYLNLTKEVYASQILQGHEGGVFCLAVHVNGGLLSSGSLNGIIKVWDTTGECLNTLQGHTSAVHCLAVDVNRGLLFSGSFDGTIKIWNIQTGECLGTLGHGNAVHCLTVDVDSGKLFSASLDGTIKVWNIQTGEFKTLQEHGNAVYCLAVDVNSGKLFSASLDGTIKVWDIQTGKCLKTFQEHQEGPVHCLIVDVKKGLLFSGSFDGTIKVWDIQTGKCLRILGHTGTVYRLVVDANSGLLFSASLGRTIKVWDIQTGECLGTLQGHEGDHCCIAVIGGRLFVGTGNNIEKRDLTASQDTILEEIAGILKTGTTAQAIQCALNRFSRMSNGVKNAIYGELYKICKPFANDYWGCGEHAFLNQYGQSSTPDQQAQAIENYLKDRSLNK